MLRVLLLLALAIPALPAGLAAQVASETPSAPDETLTLQPGDSIRLAVWREPDMSGGFLVNENGIATLPLLGDVQVTDIPLGRLRERLLEDYRELLRNPSIQVTMLRKVLVMGEVNTPGPYAVDPTESLLGVIALAEGPTSAGNPENIHIVRDGRVVVEQASPGLTLSELQIRSGDQIVVQPRSWLARNRGFVVSILLAVPSVVYTITLIGL